MTPLYKMEKSLKNFLFMFLAALTFGVLLGLAYLYYTTSLTPEGAVTRISGSELAPEEQFDIPENYPKPVAELFVTTHNHVISFSLIFLAVGIIFYFNSVIKGFWKNFLLIEPFISIIISFSSLWGIRYVDKSFVILSVISAVLIYISFFVMVFVSAYELKFKKEV